MAKLNKPPDSDECPTSLIPGSPPRHDHTNWSPSTVGGELPRPDSPGGVEPGDPNLPRWFGDHELLQEVARGGMGVVYRARHRSLGRVVALKMILNGTLASPQLVQRFQQEARAAAALDHPGIVPIYEIGQIDGQNYFTMAFVEGQSLAGRVRDGGPLPPAEAAAMMHVIAAAVAHAHKKGIIHRDLKPDNVLIDADGRPRLTDFGLAKLRAGGEAANLTGTGQILGTPAYMAPEQAMGDQKGIGPAADVYSLGGILYCMLTGQPPFKGGSLTEILFRVVQSPPAPPRQVHPDVPADLDAVCMRCLEKDPAKRYASAEELCEALSALGYAPLSLGPRSSSSQPAVSAARPAPSAHPNPYAPTVVGGPTAEPRRQPAMLLALGGLVLAAGVAVALWRPWEGRAGGPDELPSGTNGEARGEQASPSHGKAPSLAWLLEMEKDARRDFNLKVSLVGGTADGKGVYRLHDGQKIRLRVEVDRKAFVAAYTVDPQGAVLQLYPDENTRTPVLLEPGKPHLLPPEEQKPAIAEEAGGLERVIVVASSRSWDLAGGEKTGQHMLFRSREDQKKLESSLRGLRLMPEVSQAVIPFQVAAKK
jgi:hypothetical protein